MLPKARAIDPMVIKVPTALNTARLRLLKPSPIPPLTQSS